MSKLPTPFLALLILFGWFLNVSRVEAQGIKPFIKAPVPGPTQQECNNNFYENHIKFWENYFNDKSPPSCYDSRELAQNCLDAFLDQKLVKNLQYIIANLSNELAKVGITAAQKQDIKDKIKGCNDQIAHVNLVDAKARWILASKQQASINTVLHLDRQATFTDAKSLLNSIIDLLVIFVGTASFVLLVVSGLRLILAAGNDNEIQKSKSMLTYAVTGLAIALLAYLIVAFVRGILYR